MDNVSEGNLFLCMSGGYLRVMYPEPEICLDLCTWQEFCGFDHTGEAAWFGFELDSESLKVRLTERQDAPVHAPGPAKSVEVLRDPSAIRKRQALPFVPGDYTGRAHGEEVLPGPLETW